MKLTVQLVTLFTRFELVKDIKMDDLSDASDAISEIAIVTETLKKKISVNNVSALQSKLKESQLNLDWIEKLDISIDAESSNTAPELDKNSNVEKSAENDFKREMSFYNQALAGVSKAFKRLKKLGISTKRPSDFFAEMAKSDAHMKKVREKLLSKQTAIERSEKVRSMREQKKQGKKLQLEILQQRKSEKKKMINALKKAKKGKMSVDNLLGEKQNSTPKYKKSKKVREYRDNKYGYGGKKKGLKWNTADSSALYPGQNSGGPKYKTFQRNKKPRPKSHRRRR